MGKIGFTGYFHLLLTGREPTEDERFFLDLLLVSIAEHGLMPSNIAARMTLAADPESLHGAVAAGILGAGPVILGAAEECARLLVALRADESDPLVVVREIHAAGGKVPGFGHPLHRPVDPRAEQPSSSAARNARSPPPGFPRHEDAPDTRTGEQRACAARDRAAAAGRDRSRHRRMSLTCSSSEICAAGAPA